MTMRIKSQQVFVISMHVEHFFMTQFPSVAAAQLHAR